MGAVFSLSQGKVRFLVSPYELLNVLPKGFDEENAERALYSLQLDGFFELDLCDRKGEKTYCIHMREAGLNFKRSDVARRRTLAARLFLAAVCGVLSAALGLILKLLLS